MTLSANTPRRSDCLDCGTPISMMVGRCRPCWIITRRVPRRSLADRFWERVDVRGADECWPWTGTRHRKGYGTLYDHRRRSQVKATHVSLELVGIVVPPDRLACHHCDNPPCVNPRHLYVGTRSDNARDMYARGRFPSRAKTHCHRGHALEGTNLVEKPGRSRRCRICTNEGQRSRARSREAIDHTTREEDTDALHLDRARTSLVSGTSRSGPGRPLPDSDSGPTQTETSGQPVPPDGPRRHAPTGSVPPGPVGAPDLGLVP